MNYRNLGRSGLKVSRICLGSNNFGGQLSEETSIEIIDKALDCGINIIDTANTYTGGRSEKIIGKAINGRRDDIIVATKVGMSTGQKPNQTGLSRRHMLWQFECSLENLQTDFIDLYYLHRFDSDTPLEETLRTLNDLVRQGKVRYVACSNFTALQIAKAQEICGKYNLEKLVAIQPPYNILQREVEKDLLSFCEQERLGVLSYTPLMGGFLTGKYSREGPPPTGSRVAYNPRYWERLNKESNFAALEQVKRIADESDISMPKLAVAWILRNPAITAPILGASNPSQVEENCEITETNISDENYRRLNEIAKPSGTP